MTYVLHHSPFFWEEIRPQEKLEQHEFFSFKADYINTLTEGTDSNDPDSTYQDKISNDL